MVPVLLESEDGKYLGHTDVTYYGDPVEGILHQIVVDGKLQKRLFDMYDTCYSSAGNLGTTRSETQNSGSLGELIL